jgi:hypothetical protein
MKDGPEPKPVTAKELQSRSQIVVSIVCDAKASRCDVGPPIALDAKGTYSTELDLGEPVRGEVRELEMTVIVATPHVFERKLTKLRDLDPRDLLCPLMRDAHIHQTSMGE